ncbi:MAG TPA: hypothetical protein VH107_13355 [Lacipirellulaceae bacterium]|jgi:hypothetical protein|nr:hypothetical protein [Lacipirellulaceae bacterium]
MVWYVAFIAVLNLGLGYFIGLRANGSRRLAATVGDEAFDRESN